MSNVAQWYVNAFSPAAREVWEMFGDMGNFDDYWLGVPAYDNTRILGQPGWYPIELYLTVQRLREIRNWRSSDDSAEADLRHDYERGGGMMGSTPKVLHARSALIGVGRRSIEFRRRMGQ